MRKPVGRLYIQGDGIQGFDATWKERDKTHAMRFLVWMILGNGREGF
jgi:hypothetical protein